MFLFGLEEDEVLPIDNGSVTRQRMEWKRKPEWETESSPFMPGSVTQRRRGLKVRRSVNSVYSRTRDELDDERFRVHSI